MPLRLDRSFYSDLYEKFKQDHKTSGAFWSIKCRYVELYEYTLELESQNAPITKPKGEIVPMYITFTTEEVWHILENYIDDQVVKQPIAIENINFRDGEGEIIDTLEEIEIECKPKSAD